VCMCVCLCVRIQYVCLRAHARVCVCVCVHTCLHACMCKGIWWSMQYWVSEGHTNDFQNRKTHCKVSISHHFLMISLYCIQVHTNIHLISFVSRHSGKLKWLLRHFLLKINFIFVCIYLKWSNLWIFESQQFSSTLYLECTASNPMFFTTWWFRPVSSNSSSSRTQFQ
jgi:hypothetical protein